MEKVYDDDRLNSGHVSLYLSLFQFWNLKRFENPFRIFRDEVMTLSKIGSKSTYHKCLHDLNNWGYLIYFPSKNPAVGSKVKMLELGSPNSVHQKEQSVPKVGQRKEQSVPNSGHLNEPLYINNINSKHYKQVKGEKKFSTPSLDEVKEFFKNKTEAEKFFNYYTSNGWKVGGKTSMKNWQAAARNWIIKANEFSNEKGQVQKWDNLQTNQNKNYDEPL
jgi:hypothetical protein